MSSGNTITYEVEYKGQNWLASEIQATSPQEAAQRYLQEDAEQRYKHYRTATVYWGALRQHQASFPIADLQPSEAHKPSPGVSRSGEVADGTPSMGFTCPDCGKQWATGYCPECARTIALDPTSQPSPGGTQDLLPGRDSPPVSALPTAGTAPDTGNPLYGVKGWLKVLVVVNLYIGPVIFALSQILVWISYLILADKYPGLVFVGLIDTVVGSYLVVRGIQVARGLRDIQPRAVQNAKALLKLCLAWTFVSIPISFLSGLDAEDLLLGTLKGVIGGVIGFAIWYSYFNVSKRVQATYPDWKD